MLNGNNSRKVNVGDIIKLGNFNWFVLKIITGRALLLSCSVIDATYNKGGWFKGSLRYHCQAIYDNFNKQEKNLILSVKNTTQNELVETTDYIFILDVKDIIQLSGELRNKMKWRTAEWSKQAEDSLNLIKSCDTKFERGWWVRSSDNDCIYINQNGTYMYNVKRIDLCGLRPALWVRIPS